MTAPSLVTTLLTLVSLNSVAASSASPAPTQGLGVETPEEIPEETLERIKSLSAEIEEARSIADGTKFTYGGYVQLDAVSSDYSGGKPANQLIEDFLVPSLIPVEPTGGADNYRSTNMHTKSSRFFLKTATDTDVGQISSHIELDFILSGQGDERISNSWSARIRHAFVKWDHEPGGSIMVGQNWSTFFNVSTLPDHLDFVGPVGTAFMRQPQLRWTTGPLQLALENPATRLTGVEYDDGHEGLPDLIGRYDSQAGDLAWSFAGMLRELSYEDRSDPLVRGANDAKFGYAASLSGKWSLGRDDVRFMVSYGDALGRYLGLNAFNDGFIDGAGQIRTIDQLGAYAAYRRVWDPRWHSTFSYSIAEAQNPDLAEFAGAGELASAYQSAHASLNYVPTPRLRFGVELIWAEKELEDGRSGDVSRFQFSVQHAF